MISDFFSTFWGMLCEMAPYLLLGFLFAGVLHAFIPRSFYNRHLGRPGLGSVTKAALFGVPLPLCSCGVIPTAMALRREGASKGATVSFLIATPQTGVDSIAATYSMMGLPFAIVRPVAALVTAIFGGIAANDRNEKHQATQTAAHETAGSEERLSFVRKCLSALRYGFGDMLQDLGRWLLLGLVIATVITMAVPNDFFARFASMPLVGMLLVLLISVPMYLCATGSIPIAMALVLKGLSPGAALVLLMAGPATNIASILMVYKVLGRRTTAIYVGSIIVGAIAFGLAIDYLMPASWFAIVSAPGSCAHCAMSAPDTPWLELTSGVMLCALLAAGLFVRHGGHNHNHENHNSKPTNHMQTFKITGMMCNHCRANVEKALTSMPGVTAVTVDLQTGSATVEGTAAPDEIIATVSSLGYTAALA